MKQKYLNKKKKPRSFVCFGGSNTMRVISCFQEFKVNFPDWWVALPSTTGMPDLLLLYSSAVFKKIIYFYEVQLSYKLKAL